MSLVHILAKEEIYFSKIYSSSAANIAEIFNHSGNPRKKIYIYYTDIFSYFFHFIFTYCIFGCAGSLSLCRGFL